MAIETEKKYLIKRPSWAELILRGARPVGIKQVYLTPQGAATEVRVRMIKPPFRPAEYVRTEKTAIPGKPESRVENESPILREEYEASVRNLGVRGLIKTRWTYWLFHNRPGRKYQKYEIDIYPDRKKEAVLEIEEDVLQADDVILGDMPKWIKIIRDITLEEA